MGRRRDTWRYLSENPRTASEEGTERYDLSHKSALQEFPHWAADTTQITAANQHASRFWDSAEVRREFIVDSGASYHLVSQTELTSQERKQARSLQDQVSLLTANEATSSRYVTDIIIKMLGNAKVESFILPQTVNVLS